MKFIHGTVNFTEKLVGRPLVHNRVSKKPDDDWSSGFQKLFHVFFFLSPWSQEDISSFRVTDVTTRYANANHIVVHFTLRSQSSCIATSEKRDLNAPRENSDRFNAALAIDLSSSSISILPDFPCMNDSMENANLVQMRKLSKVKYRVQNTC